MAQDAISLDHGLYMGKCGGLDPIVQVRDLGPAVNSSITMNDQSLNDVVLCHVHSNIVTLVPCSSVTGLFQVLQATVCIPDKVVHIPWSKEMFKDELVTPAAAWGNASLGLHVNPRGCGADHDRQDLIDLDNVAQEGRIK